MADERIRVVIEGTALDLERALKSAGRDLDKFDAKVKASGGTTRAHNKEVDKSILGFGELSRTVLKTNQAFTLLGNTMKLVKWPAMIAGAGLAVQAIDALAAGVVGLVGAMGPLTGVAAAGASAFIALGTAAGVAKLAFGGMGKALGGNKKAIEALTPQGRALLEVLKGMKKHTDALRVTAQKGLFPGVVEGLKRGTPVFKSLNVVVGQTAKVMGSLAAQLGKLVGSKAFGKDLRSIGGNNAKVLHELGMAGLSLVKVFMDVLVAAEPLTLWMSKQIRVGAELLEQTTQHGRETGKLGHFFAETKHELISFGHVLGNLAVVFLNVGKAAKPMGDALLHDLEGITAKWREWTGSVSGQNSMGRYFQAQLPAIREMGKLLGAVAAAFVGMGKNNGLAPLLAQIRTQLLPVLVSLVDNTTKAFGPVLVRSLVQVVGLLARLGGSSGPLANLVKGFGLAAQGLNWLLDNIPGLNAVLVTVLAAGGIYKALKIGAALTGIKGMVGTLRIVLGKMMAMVLATDIGETLALKTMYGFAPIQGRMKTIGAAAGRAFAAGFALAIPGLVAYVLHEIGNVVENIIDPQHRQDQFDSTQSRAFHDKGGVAGAVADVQDFLKHPFGIGSRRGGRLSFQDGGMVPAVLSPGELGVLPGGGAFMVPGAPVAADTVPMVLPSGTAVVTGHGQQLMAGGASLNEALAMQLPHFAAGGIVTASRFGGHDDPSAYQKKTASGKVANDSLWGWAELSDPPGSLNFSAMGNLPMGADITVELNGKSVTVPKVDKGAGGPGLGGHKRAVDLTYAAAMRLGLNGLQNVLVSSVDGKETDKGVTRSGGTWEYAGAPGRSWGRGFEAGAAGKSIRSTDYWKSLQNYAVGTYKPPQVNSLSNLTDATTAGTGGLSGSVGTIPAFTGTPMAPNLLAAMKLAQRDGLSITSTTQGQHARNSWHYSGHAFDASNSNGPTKEENQFARQIAGAYGSNLTELFYDPLGWYVKNGKIVQGAIGGHSDHVHVAMAGGPSLLANTAPQTRSTPRLPGGLSNAGARRNVAARTGGVLGAGGGIGRVNAGVSGVMSAKHNTKGGPLNASLRAFSRAIDSPDEVAASTLNQVAAIMRATLDKLKGTALRRTKAMLSIIEATLGERTGKQFLQIENTHARTQKGLDWNSAAAFRLTGIDPGSSKGIAMSLDANQRSMANARSEQGQLQQVLKSAVAHKDTAAIATIKARLSDVGDVLREGAVTQIELTRQAAEQAVQDLHDGLNRAVDNASFGSSYAQGGLSNFGLEQQLSGTYDTPEGRKARADMISGTIIPTLKGQLQAQNAVTESYAVGSPEWQASKLAAQGIQGQILQANLDIKDLLAVQGPTTQDLLDVANEQLAAANATVNLLTRTIPVLSGFGPLVSQRMVGSFASGTDWIDETGMALVHRGEAVLTAPEAAAARAGLRGGDGAYTPQIVVHAHGDLGAVMSRLEATVDGRAARVVSEQLGRRARNMTVGRI